MVHGQVVATGWNHKVLVWQDEEAETVSEYRMFSGHRCAHHHVQSSCYRSLWLQVHTSLIPVLCPKQITQAIPPMFAALTRQSHCQLTVLCYMTNLAALCTLLHGMQGYKRHCVN